MDRSGFLRFFNLYDKSLPENQTKRGEIDFFRTISKVLVYVCCSKRIVFRRSSETLWELRSLPSSRFSVPSMFVVAKKTVQTDPTVAKIGFLILVNLFCM
jgi:hypothetical protein